MKTPERCCDNSEWPRDHDADCGQRTKPLEGGASPFDVALAAAREAIKEMGAGRHRTTLVREGARTYAQRDQGMPLEVAKPSAEPTIAPCVNCSTHLRTIDELRRQLAVARADVRKCDCATQVDHIYSGCTGRKSGHSEASSYNGGW